MRLFLSIATVVLLTQPLLADSIGDERPEISVQRLSRTPTIEDFLDMRPPADLAAEMARVEGFIQQEPEDGRPSTQRTEAYIGYDQQNLFVAFIAFDSEPEKIRARLNRRENVFGDEIVEIQLDTYHDERRAFSFVANPVGIQWDAIWSEGNGFDSSWDTVWKSDGQLTDLGYVVLMTIPFKSLRFPQTEEQTWGFVLVRDIPRNNENTFWPRVSNRIQGRLNQGATMRGLEGISPGRNIWLIPYTTARRFRLLDPPGEVDPRFRRDSFDGDFGMDGKLVIKDSLALDLTANPDFSQVESDQPQVTVNERFEVFFPERRPFFLENSSLFQTPFNLLFTRRIQEPRAGARLTGKLGAYSLGVMSIDDEAPGKVLDPGDRGYDKTALFNVVRLSRDISDQSNVGFLYTDRTFEQSFNRVGGIDGRYKLNDHWDTRFQAVYSDTRTTDDEQFSDTAYSLEFNRSGRHIGHHLHYREVGPDFLTQSGFVNRTDVRNYHQSSSYTFRPEGKRLVSWGPRLFAERIWGHDGSRLDATLNAEIEWEFRGQTEIELEYRDGRTRLRPVDFNTLTVPTDFSRDRLRLEFETEALKAVTFEAEVNVGDTINFAPPDGSPPGPAESISGSVELSLKPGRRTRIDTVYLFRRLDDAATDTRLFTNQILRTRLNWQFNSKLSIRAILQYDETDANPGMTRLESTERYNGDLLATYLVNPWTALYVGYNSNYENLDLIEDPREVVRTDGQFTNNARQLFVKFSYLFRL